MPKSDEEKDTGNGSEEEIQVNPKKSKKKTSDDEVSSEEEKKKKAPKKKSSKKDEEKPAKKTKTEKPKKTEEETVIELGEPLTRLTVRQFKGKTYIDIRKFYEDKNSKEIKPGSKGISLTVEQWGHVKEAVEKVDEAISNF
jgi:hypothetical protein